MFRDRFGKRANARVSAADKNLDIPIAAFEAAGCTMIRTETGGRRHHHGTVPNSGASPNQLCFRYFMPKYVGILQ